MTVAEKLIKARGVQTQKQVADAIGIAQTTLSMYEKGQRLPRPPVMKKLADYYRTTVGALFFGE